MSVNQIFAQEEWMSEMITFIVSTLSDPGITSAALVTVVALAALAVAALSILAMAQAIKTLSKRR